MATMTKKMKINFADFFMDGDLLMEILKRLNATTLLRFRRVCKQWDRTIRQPYFADLHHSFHRSLPHAAATLLFSFVHTTIICGADHKNWWMSTLYFFKIGENRIADPYFSVNASELGFNTIDCVSDVVHGLVCISNYNRAAVCNITTGEFVLLPKTRRRSFKLAAPLLGRKRERYVPHYSFGFDPSKKYKVLRIWVNSLGNFVRCELFVIGTSKHWKEIKINVLLTKNNLNAFDNKSICIDGCLYWLTQYSTPFQVITFDFRDEKFRTINVPESLYKSMKGKLSPIQVGGHFGIRSFSSIYVLDEQKQGWIGKSDLDIDKSAVHVGSSETRLFFIKIVRYHSIAGLPSMNLFCLDHNGMQRSSFKISGSFPGESSNSSLFSIMPKSAITEHVENIYSLARI